MIVREFRLILALYLSHEKVVASANDSMQGNFTALHQTLRKGDLISARGYPGKTLTGETSLFAVEVIKIRSTHIRPIFSLLACTMSPMI
jgi:lysyl-tRNA synthetase class II